MQDDSFDRLLRKSLRRDTPEAACPDPSVLAAFADGGLSPDERRELQTHASSCARCSLELALLAKTADEPGVRPAPSPGKRLAVPWRWAVPLATAVLVFAVWTETGQRDRRTEPGRTTAPGASTPALGGTALRRGVPEDPAAPARPVVPSKPANPAEKGASSSALAKREHYSAPPPAETDPERGHEPSGTEPRAVPGGVGPERQSKARGPADAAAKDALRERRAESPPDPDRSPVPAASADAAGDAETVPLEAAPRNAAVHDLRKDDEAPPVIVLEAPAGVRVRVSAAGVERSTDTGTSWQREHGTPLETIRLGGCPTATACWLGGDGGLILRRESSGRWVESRLPVRARVTGIEARDAVHATATVAGGRRFATGDGGRTWSPLP